MTGGNSLRDDGAAGVLADMDHFGPGIRLLVVGSDGYGIELADGVIPFQNAARVLPGNCGTRFHLSPGNLGIAAFTFASFGHEVINTTLAFLISGIPVLDG
jgi:hypothetical protein